MSYPRIIPSTLALLAAAAAWPVRADIADPAPEVTLRAVVVKGAGEAPGFVATRAPSSTKSDTPLIETPHSVSVITRELMESQQTQTLTDALRNVAGVVSANFGRRGWDDFIIRGQRASESVFLDGLPVSRNSWIAQEPFGMERIEVLKGPASILFGQVQPGGMVNMVSKRPRAEPFNEIGLTVGSDDFKRATFDFGRPLSETGRAAFRVNGLWLDRDDPTDFVYQKHHWIAPSLSLDLGADTDFTLLASYNYNEYLRQQGLSPHGTILPNPNGKLDFDLFVGEPGFGPYEAEQTRLGYALAHRFSNGWTLRQNFRWQEYHVDGRGVFHGVLQADRRTQRRTAVLQDIDGRVLGLDTHAERRFDTLGATHTLLVGLDLQDDRDRFGRYTCTVGPLDLYEPVYGGSVRCPSAPNSDVTTTISSAAVYARDQVRIGERLHLLVGLRRDHSRNEARDRRARSTETQHDRATIKSAGLMYELRPGVVPYVSYTDSFLPQSGTTASGKQFEPETGEQAEVGVKLSFAEGRVAATLAYYELTRRNVTTADPVNTGFSVLTGEQESRGFELETAMDLGSGWSLTGAYAYTDGEVTEDTNPGIVGRRLNNVPRHGASLWAAYRARTGFLAGWGFGAGARYESEKKGFSFDYTIPSYTAWDAAVSYQGDGYRVALNVKNLFDEKYYAGGLNNNVVALGDPRQVLLSATFEF